MPKGRPKRQVELEAQVLALKVELEAIKGKRSLEIPAIKVLPKVPDIIEAPVIVSPVPSDYRHLVDTILNNQFGVQIKPLNDRPAFELIIDVPKKYSNAPLPHWDTYGNDLRHKVISNAENINGVREWVERVFKNLDQDARTRIVLERDTASVAVTNK